MLNEYRFNFWTPISRGKMISTLLCTAQTIRNYALWLANFLEYGLVRHINLETCNSLNHIHDDYQDEMAERKWPPNENKISAHTVIFDCNRHVIILIVFQTKSFNHLSRFPLAQ